MSEAAAHRHEPRLPARRRVTRALIALAVTVVAFAATLRFGLGELDELEAFARDVNARARLPEPSDSIVLVTVTDSDYSTLFDGVSPLNAASLQRLVQKALDSKARVVGIDIETSHPSFGALRVFARDPARRSRLVWAQDARGCPTGREEQSRDEPSLHCAPGKFVALGVLGATDSARRADSVVTGLVISPLDRRGVLRYYSRFLPMTTGNAETFTGAMSSHYARPTGIARASDTAPRFIDFHEGRSAAWELTAAELLALPESSDLLRDRAVLIGGAYRAARDDHLTPLGALPGVDIQAQALETELRGRGVSVPSRERLVAIEIVAGAVIVLLLLLLPLGRAGLVLVVALPVVTMAASWLATRSWTNGAMYFAPFLGLLVLHHFYEEAVHWRTRWLEETYRQASNLAEPSEPALGPLVERADDLFVEGTARVAQSMRRMWRRHPRRVADPEGAATAPTKQDGGED